MLRRFGPDPRSLLPLSLAMLLAACGGEKPDGPVHENPAADPLGLARCERTVPPWTGAVPLPPLSWVDESDWEAHCATRTLDAELEKARIICLGENDHGVSETTRWDAALLRYLIHRWNVRTIAYENDAASTAPLNRYLSSGDPVDLEEGFADTAGTLGGSVEAEQLIEAIRAIGAELPPGDRVVWTGFDVAVQPGPSILALAEYMERVAPGEPTGVEDWKTMGFSKAASAASDLLEKLETNRARYVAASDDASWRRARTDAANLRDGFLFLASYASGDFGTGNARHREPGMIRNVEELAANLREGERMVLLAHNLHCAKNIPAAGATSVEESPATGTHLARSETWGPKYFVLAQLYNRGRHLVLDTPIKEQAFDSGANSLAGAIGEIWDVPALLLSTRTTELDMDRTWDLRPMGTSYRAVPSEQFDGFLWVDEVTSATLR